MKIILFLVVAIPVRSVLPLMAVGMMSHAGVFNSHKDRRRQKDKTPACESSNPLDTTDDDCYTARWNLMVGYFPAHLGLKRMDNKIVAGEAEVEKLWGAASSGMANNKASLSGPSGNVIEEAAVLTKAAAMLSRAFRDALISLGHTKETMSSNASSDVKEMKNITTVAFSALKDNVTDITAKEDASVTRNAVRMNQRASSVLRTAVAGLLDAERNVSFSVVGGVEKLEKVKMTTVSNLTALGSRIKDDLATKAESIKESIDTQLSDMKTGFTDKSDRVAAAFEKGNERMIEKSSSITSELKSRSKTQWADTKTDWDSMSSSGLARARNSTVIVGLGDASYALKLAASKLADKTNEGTSHVENFFAKSVNSTKALFNKVRSTADETDQSTADTKATADAIGADIRVPLAVGGPPNVSTLMNSLGKEQSEAQTGILSTEASYTDTVSDSLKNQGKAGETAEGKLGKLETDIQSGATSSESTVKSASKTFFDKAHKTTLMDALDTLDVKGIPVVPNGCPGCTSNYTRVAVLVSEVVASNLSRIDSDPGLLNQAANASRVASELDASLRQIGRSGSVLHTMAGQEDATGGMAASLVVVDSEIADRIDGEVSGWKKQGNIDQSELKRIFNSAENTLTASQRANDQNLAGLAVVEAKVESANGRSRERLGGMASHMPQLAEADSSKLDTTISNLDFATSGYVNASTASFQVFTAEQTSAMKLFVTSHIHLGLNASTDYSDFSLTSPSHSSPKLAADIPLSQVSTKLAETSEKESVDLDSFSQLTIALQSDLLKAQNAETLQFDMFVQELVRELGNVSGRVGVGTHHRFELDGMELGAIGLEERGEALGGGMDILSKLQAMQAIGADAASEIRTKLGRAAGIRLPGAVALREALNAVDVNTDGSSVESQTRRIIDRLGDVACEASNSVSNDIARSSLEDLKDLNRWRAKDHNDTQKLQSVFGQVQDGLSTLGHVLSNSTARMGHIGAATDTSADAVVAGISAALQNIKKGSDLLNVTREDPLTELTVTRSALTAFLALWREFAFADSRKLQRISAGDQDLIAGIEAGIETQLTELVTETKKLASVDPRTEAASRIFEGLFDRNLLWLLGQLNATHNAVNAQAFGMTQNMDALLNFASEFNTNELNEIENLIQSAFT